MKYLSCFSGIGGLEASVPPFAVCEIDTNCQRVLRNKYKDVNVIPDVREIGGFSVDVIVGGWPCQDLSVAGRKRGLTGANSGLFYKFVEAAEKTNAKTLIAENVTNLLRLDNGKVFLEVLRELREKDYKYISWRVLNARQFGLPHSRNRVFLIASESKESCFTIFRDLPKAALKESGVQADGFYWTAGSQSINYSRGYVPTIKVGSTLAISSPPAVVYDDIVRQLTTSEALQLQGFTLKHFAGLKNDGSS
jgi:DNA (cytosine-5)-methyltransferase 1